MFGLKSLFGSKKIDNSTENKSVDNTERKSSLPISLDSFLGFALAYQNIPGFNFISDFTAFKFYNQCAPLNTAINMIAEEAEQIKPVVKNISGNVTDKHEALDIINNPNGYQIGSEFIGASIRHKLITNNAYFYFGGNINYKPIEIYSVKPQNVSTIENIIKFPGQFTVNMGLGSGIYNEKLTKNGVRYYDGNLKELYYMSGFSSMSSESRAETPLGAICLDIQQQLKGKVYNVQLLTNGGRPSLLVNIKQQLEIDKLKEIKQYIKEQLAGESNAGEIAVTNSDLLEINELGTSNKDMDYLNLSNASSYAIYLRYKIPLPIITVDASTLNNLDVSYYALYDRAVLPAFQNWGDHITRALMPRLGINPNSEIITYDEEDIKALLPRRIEILSKRKEMGIETINELRSDLSNREPIEGGDTLYQQANLIPLGEDVTKDKDIDEQLKELIERDRN